MALKVAASSLTRYKNLAEKAMERARRVREKGQEAIERGVRTTVSSATAFGLGMVQGRTGGVELFGKLPLELLVGAGAHVAGYMKVGGRNSEHLHAVGDGALALYAGTMGRAVGTQWKTTGRLLGAPKVAGELPSSGADYASDEELASAVAAARR